MGSKRIENIRSEAALASIPLRPVRPPPYGLILISAGVSFINNPAKNIHPTLPMPWPLTSRASGATSRSLTCLCVARRQATLPSPIRCSCSRGRCAGLSRLIFPCLKTRKIPFDPPLRRW